MSIPLQYFHIICLPVIVIILIPYGCRIWMNRMHYRTNWELLFPLATLLTIITSAGLVYYCHCDAGHPIPSQGCSGAMFCAWKTIGELLEFDGSFLLDSVTAAQHPVWPVPILTFLVPVFTVGTVIVFLCDRIPHPMLPSGEYAIFSKLDEQSYLMAKSLEQEGLRFIFLRTRREDIPADLLQPLCSLSYQLYPFTEVELLRRHWLVRQKVLHFYFITNHTDANFEQLTKLIDAVERSKRPLFENPGTFPKDAYRQELYVLSETSTAPMLIDSLREKLCDKETKQRKAVFAHTDLHLLDRYRALSYDLLFQTPIRLGVHDNKNHVLMLGFGRFGQEFYRIASSSCIEANTTTAFTICDQNARKTMEAMRQQAPRITRGLKVQVLDLNIESHRLQKLLESCSKRGNPITYILVALGDDERNIRVALYLMRYFRKLYWEKQINHFPALCVNIEDPIKSDNACKLLEELHVGTEPKPQVFGSLSQIFTAKVLTPRNAWLAAKRLHMGYCSTDQEPIFWQEYDRRSSLASAYHAPIHCKSCGTDDDLLDAEHRRWMRYVSAEGMRLAERKTMEGYIPQLRKHVDVIGQLSPCLVRTEQLEELYQDIWRDTELQKHLQWTKKRKTFQEGDQYIIRNKEKLNNILTEGKPDIYLDNYN